MRSAFELRDSTQCARTCGCSVSRSRCRMVFAIRKNGARHACEFKAVSPLGNGFIFAVDFVRLFARAVANRQDHIESSFANSGGQRMRLKDLPLRGLYRKPACPISTVASVCEPSRTLNVTAAPSRGMCVVLSEISTTCLGGVSSSARPYLPSRRRDPAIIDVEAEEREDGRRMAVDGLDIVWVIAAGNTTPVTGIPFRKFAAETSLAFVSAGGRRASAPTPTTRAVRRRGSSGWRRANPAPSASAAASASRACRKPRPSWRT